MSILIVFAFLAGIFTVLSPCILPILPIILSAGIAKGRFRPLGIILGLVVSFTLFTLFSTAIIHATGIPANALRYMAIFFIALFGLIMLVPSLSTYFAKMTNSIAAAGQSVQSSGNGFFSGILFGIALGLVWTPCAGPILAAIITLAASQSVSLQTFLITLAYSLGAAIPLFLIAYGSGKLIQLSKSLSTHSEKIRQFFGLLMIVTALLMALNWDMLIQQKITPYLPSILIENNAVVKNELAKLRPTGSSHFVQPPEDTFGNYGNSPDFEGIVNWINSQPLSLMNLKGKVVLIDFWTYSCINCLRTLPFLKKWDNEYRDKGLVIVGVHTPEFEFEKDPKNVAEAVARLGINYPVAQDNDYKTWNAFQNRYWPAHYLIDQNHQLRIVHFGEGGYADTENAIRQLLGLKALKMSEPTSSKRALSSETYLGTSRGTSYTPENKIVPNQIHQYDYQSELQNDQVGLKGFWKIEEERITSESDDSYLNMKYLAKNVYLVLSGSSSTPVLVSLDGKTITKIVVKEDRKYDIVNADYGWHQLSLKIPKGISAYAFTFGDE